MQTTPASLSGYPANAWFRYTDTTCTYNCMAIEYLYWGFCAYSGMCAGLAGGDKTSSYEQEFSLVKRADFVSKDKALAKLFQDSEAMSVSYRLPTRAVDGIYTGCKKCGQVGGKNHGGN